MPAADNTKVVAPSQFASLVESGHPAITFHSSSQSLPAHVSQQLTSHEAKSNTLLHKSGPRSVPYASIPESIRRIIDSDMSSDAAPISSAAFAAALTSLTLPTLHVKAAEIRNQRAHLQNSNIELQGFADDGDEDCQEALRENGVVLHRMQERLELIRTEVVENRGMIWVEEDRAMDNDNAAIRGVVVNGRTEDSDNTRDARDMANGATGQIQTTHGESGTLDDAELARRLQERLAEESESNTDGVHL